MSKPEVSRRNEDGDRIAVIHAYAPGDGNLSFVVADVEHPHSAVSPSPTREECEAACPYGWELYQEGPSWRARRFATASPITAPILLPLPALKEKDFSIEADAQGYRIIYQGHNIGGAGTLGKFKGAGRPRAGFPNRAVEQTADYHQQAQSEIKSLLAGHGQARFQTIIDEIDAEPVPDFKQPS
jgi:hypothetical protein